MMRAKKFLFFLALLPFSIAGQSIEVKKEALRIKGENTAGYQVAIAAAEQEVKTSLLKFLKNIGKTKQSDNMITVAEPEIGGKKYSTTLYSTARQTGDTGAAWMGILSEGEKESNLDRDIEKLIYDFAVTFHREKIQIQIDESLRALQAVEKQQLRLLNQHKDLNNKIEHNKREKIQLEKELADNKIELEDLKMKLEANSKAQDSVAVATEQIRKVVELHKGRHQKVN
jgi:hypothetical protein